MLQTGSARDRWIVRPRPDPNARLRLFCFPFAGSGSIVYRTWPERIRRGVETCLVDLPGRGRRIHETPHREMSALVEDAAQGLRDFLDRPFAFFGHSMGALLGFELARRLRREHLPEPVRLFASGHRAPQLPMSHKPLHDLPPAEFVRELRDLNGTPTEVLENAELMQLLEPVLRADFSVCERYRYYDAPRLSCDIVAIGGDRDPNLRLEALEAWREQTLGACSAHVLPGDHFLLQTSEAAVLKLVNQELDRAAAESLWSFS